MSNSTSALNGTRSRALASGLALAGLVGMFFALLGWTGHVHEYYKVWSVLPMVWVAMGLLLSIAAAAADAALGSDADFTQGNGAGARLVNRFLPWIIVALTFVGMAAISLKGAS